jgi:hypothetical protein
MSVTRWYNTRITNNKKDKGEKVQMHKRDEIRSRVRKSVLRAYEAWQGAGAADSRGYVLRPEDNLVPGVAMAQFQGDLEKGAGKELQGKFCAVHSSAALVVNSFAPFKDRSDELVVMGERGFTALAFEQELNTGLRGTPPTVDVLLRRDREVVAVESKFLEYFQPTQPRFAASYDRLQGEVEACWWQVLADARESGPGHLDIAQLWKHQAGLNRLLKQGGADGWRPEKTTLLYLYWEPENATELAPCLQHRQEVERLASRVQGARVGFRALSYRALWQEWTKEPALAPHVAALQRRYTVTVAGGAA